MSNEQVKPTNADQGLLGEALSNEVLKLKIDDLFQEIEHIKRRLERVEGQPDRGGLSDLERTAGSAGMGMVSNPDSGH